jgi:hypothetical protein
MPHNTELDNRRPMRVHLARVYHTAVRSFTRTLTHVSGTLQMVKQRLSMFYSGRHYVR